MNPVLRQIINPVHSTYSQGHEFDPRWCHSTWRSNGNNEFSAWVISEQGLELTGHNSGGWSYRFKKPRFEQGELFGTPAFLARTNSGQLVPFLPKMQFLNPQGNVCETMVPGQRLREILEFYLEEVPINLRILMGRTYDPCHGWLMLDVICRVPDLLVQSRVSPGYFFEATRLLLEKLYMLDMDAAGHALACVKRQAFLSALLRQNVGNWQIRALEKFAPDIRLASRQAFWALSRKGRSTRVLGHAKTISNEVVEACHLVPDWMEKSNPRICDLVSEEHLGLLRKLEEDGFLCMMRKGPKDFQKIAAGVGSRDEFRALLEICLDPREFPSPPLKNYGKLVPIDSHKKLKQVALRFRNCARTYTEQIMDGDAYFFLLEEDPPILVLVRNCEERWFVAQAETLNGDFINEEKRFAITDMVERPGNLRSKVGSSGGSTK